MTHAFLSCGPGSWIPEQPPPQPPGLPIGQASATRSHLSAIPRGKWTAAQPAAGGPLSRWAPQGSLSWWGARAPSPCSSLLPHGSVPRHAQQGPGVTTLSGCTSRTGGRGSGREERLPQQRVATPQHKPFSSYLPVRPARRLCSQEIAWRPRAVGDSGARGSFGRKGQNRSKEVALKAAGGRSFLSHQPPVSSGGDGCTSHLKAGRGAGRMTALNNPGARRICGLQRIGSVHSSCGGVRAPLALTKPSQMVATLPLLPLGGKQRRKGTSGSPADLHRVRGTVWLQVHSLSSVPPLAYVPNSP